MTVAGSYDELEFELALTGVLEDIYDLKVRTERDLLNRRRNGYTTLEFHYQYDRGSSDVKDVGSIPGVPGSSYVLHADFSDADRISESAEDCEELAMAVASYLASVDDPRSSEQSRRRDD